MVFRLFNWLERVHSHEFSFFLFIYLLFRYYCWCYNFVLVGVVEEIFWRVFIFQIRAKCNCFYSKEYRKMFYWTRYEWFSLWLEFLLFWKCSLLPFLFRSVFTVRKKKLKHASSFFLYGQQANNYAISL